VDADPLEAVDELAQLVARHDQVGLGGDAEARPVVVVPEPLGVRDLGHVGVFGVHGAEDHADPVESRRDPRALRGPEA
jgi:hypothetical protein